MKKRLLIGLAFIVSVSIHLGSFFSLYFMPKPKPTNDKPLEVTLLSPTQKKPVATTTALDEAKLKQIVEQNKTNNDEKPADAKYLSQFNQKVKKETKAAATGKFQNTGGQGVAKAQAEQKAQTAVVEKAESEKPSKSVSEKVVKAEAKKQFTVGSTQTYDPSAPSALDSFKPNYDWTKAVRDRDMKEDLAAKTGGDGNAISQTNDYLPNADKGIQTQLNTREFMYYSYYNRIKQQLNQFWEPKLKEKVADLFRHGRHIASKDDHVTKLLIILNDKGTLVDVKVLGASGETSLDEAAIEAFQAAAPFPNPPKGIVESDGTIKIRWDFILEV